MAIIRVFGATIFPDKIDDFHRFFLDEAAPLVKRHQGLISMQIGLPCAASPHEFLMITVWKDLPSLIGFTGDNWQEARIDPGEAHLIQRAFVHHYEQA